MNKELPCYIVSDLLPFYEDEILSNETKSDIDKHISECAECKKKMDAVKMHINVKHSTAELKENPLKKVGYYQKIQTLLGAIIAFILGASIPAIYLGLLVLDRGEIAAYQVQRFKILWYKVVIDSCLTGLFVCGIYFLTIFIIKKCVSRKKLR